MSNVRVRIFTAGEINPELQTGKYYWAHPATDSGKPQGGFDRPDQAAIAAETAGYEVGMGDLDEDAQDALEVELFEDPELVNRLAAAEPAEQE